MLCRLGVECFTSSKLKCNMDFLGSASGVRCSQDLENWHAAIIDQQQETIYKQMVESFEEDERKADAAAAGEGY